MKIYDCFMYFDEDLVLELRLNTLNKYIDYFVIVESSFTHKGEERKLKFEINKYEKFKDKIIYIKHDSCPKNIEIINNNDSEYEKSSKYILNAAKRENEQRNYIEKGLFKAKPEDLIIISDIDEIPNLENINFLKIKKKINFI